MRAEEIRNIIRRNSDNIAFVIGNGINRFPDNPEGSSWDDLLIRLWDKVSFQTLTRRPQGISITEFYDILEGENRGDLNLQAEVARLMAGWQPKPHHKAIIDKIRGIGAPVLTINFDEMLARTTGCKLLRADSKGFTDFYPWTIMGPTFSQVPIPVSVYGI